VIRTKDVDRRTTLLLCRFRLQLVAELPDGEHPMLAEDAVVMGFTGPPEQPQWLAQQDAEALLAARGCRMQRDPSLFARDTRFAGDDEMRLAAVARAASAPGADVALAARGGYGWSRLLDRIDFRTLAASGKRWLGHSDFTAFQLVVALKPLHDYAKITRVVVSTYQSVSGAGKEGMDELFEQSRNIFVGDSADAKKFTKQIAFNVIPHIDSFLDDGYTKEEWKMMVEVKKILDPKIKLTATCVRVPVFVGHSEAVNIEYEREMSAETAQNILREAPGIMLIDKREDGGYTTPVEAAGDDATYVSRVREDPTVDNGLAFWCVSDNLRKGAALNAVQIAELLGRRHLKKG
jgi:hypothetical protein